MFDVAFIVKSLKLEQMLDVESWNEMYEYENVMTNDWFLVYKQQFHYYAFIHRKLLSDVKARVEIKRKPDSCLKRENIKINEQEFAKRLSLRCQEAAAPRSPFNYFLYEASNEIQCLI